jgi:hypothetical protein
LKTYKTASLTIQNIFLRYGYLNNKIFVLQTYDTYIRHPRPFHPSLVPYPKLFNHEYNILAHHSRLDYKSMNSLVSNGTLFISIIRNPVELFESMLNYYRLDKFWNITFDTFGDKLIRIPNYIYREKNF